MKSQEGQIPPFDFMDLDFFASQDPHQVWHALRLHAPVYWHEKQGQAGFWLVTKHADVILVSHDSKTFVSQRGVGPPCPSDSIVPANACLRPEAARRALNLLDPPDHTKMRRIFSSAFTPRAVSRWEPTVRGLGNRVLEQIAHAGSADFVQDFAMRVPLAVLGTVMGIPQDDWPLLAKWTADRAPDYSSDPGRDESEHRMASDLALEELSRYLWKLFTMRQREPREDIISELVVLKKQGQLTESEVMWFCLLLVGAGHETTCNALSGGIVAMLEHRDQLRTLSKNPSLLDKAVEEVLRWTSPIVFFSRFVTRDTMLRGQRIRSGQRVFLVYPSANRDEEVFECPNRFDISREPNDHVALGAGNHFCLGAALARLQLRTLMPLVFARFPTIDFLGQPQRLRSNFSAGYSRLPIQYSTQDEERKSRNL